jgi:6-phosphogluconolactonase
LLARAAGFGSNQLVIQTKALAIAIEFALMTVLFSSSSIDAAAATASSKQPLVYVGAFTGPSKGKGIYAYRMDLDSGAMTPLGLAAETDSPTFLDVDSKGRHVYAINEIEHFDGKPAGAVSAFSIDRASGKLTPLNQLSSVGTGPCYVMVDRGGRNALVANYAGGSIAVLPIGSDGRLKDASAFIQHTGKSVNPDRQAGPHAHCLTLDPAGHFAFACDLGLDKILIYKLDSKSGKLVPNHPAFAEVKPGDGPRHIAFDPSGHFAYVITEMHSTIVAFKYDSRRGALEEVQTVSSVPDDFTGNKWGAEIQVHPSGKFLYASNRNHDSIAVFAIDAATGKLTSLQHEPTQGKTPRYFTLDPTGKFLLAANQDSDTIVIFRVDPTTGRLTPTGQTVQIPGPACIKFVPGIPVAN